MMWWAMWCAAVVAGTTAAAPADPLPHLDLLQIDPPAPDDQESLSYAPSSAGAGGADFSLSGPLYYYLDQPHDSQSMLSEMGERRARLKRKMPSLSINNPMEVLRQRLMLEVVRKQMRDANQRQAVANRVFLQNVGKRGFWSNPAQSRYDN